MTGSPDQSLSDFSSVVLCSDILATRQSEQASNLRWVADLFSRPIGKALPDARIRIGLNDNFDRGDVLKGVVTDEALKDRHCWFDPEGLGDEALNALRDAIGEKTLLVGYELSKMTRKVLTKINVSWIDIWLHPVRFADDIFFAMRASDPRVQARLSEFKVAEEALYAQADLLKVQNYRGFGSAATNLTDGAALFIGQTSKDKSVLDARGFLDLSDFRSEFEGLAQRYPHVYFSRHPHQPHLHGDIRALLKEIGNVSETIVPTYHLLADKRIASVTSISSSVLEEARYFGKKAHRFLAAPFPLEGEGRYETILQSPCFSHFWSSLLQDVASVAQTEPASFVDPKNKLRHALSFTWGYRDIDKYEAMHRDANAVEKGNAPAITIETAELVTFDVFDTLITRRVATPSDVFQIMAQDAVAITGGAASEFSSQRIAAEKNAARIAQTSGKEDPTLEGIYAAFMDCSEGDSRVEKLCALEIASEKTVILKRQSGAVLYEKARQAGRRIILVSDMYLSRETIEGFLSDCGYAGWDDIYVSSEQGGTKRSGTLFEHLLSTLGIDAGSILHIGDNPNGDVAVPERYGLAVKHLPMALDNMRAAAPFLRKSVAALSNRSQSGGSAIIAQIANTHYDAQSSTSLTGGFGRDAGRLGYVVLGPLLAGFADWLHHKAKAEGIEKLGFLTREGPLLRAAYEMLFAHDHLPSQTVIASRRIVQGASLVTRDKVEGAAQQFGAGYVGSAADFLTTHFGLSEREIDHAAVAAVGFEGDKAQITTDTPIEYLLKVVDLHKDAIMERANLAQATLSQYLSESGLTKGRVGLVDIGYAGQVQAGYSNVANSEMSGFYLATFRKSWDVLAGLVSHAFLAERVASNDKRFGICRHRQIYETLLCAPGPSFVGVAKDGDGWRGIPAPKGTTPVRDAFVREAHEGALRFVRDFATDRISSSAISPYAATTIVDAMLDDPPRELAAWLGTLEFDESFAIDEVSTLIDAGHAPSRSVWPEGARALNAKAKNRTRIKPKAWKAFGPYGVFGWRHAFSPLVAPIIARIGDAKDADHYRDDPIAFFRRLSDPRYRRIGRILYPWD